MVVMCVAVHGGDYWRLLTPGDYEVSATAEDYMSLTHTITVTNPPHKEALRRDFDLTAFPDESMLQHIPVCTHGPTQWSLILSSYGLIDVCHGLSRSALVSAILIFCSCIFISVFNVLSLCIIIGAVDVLGS